MPKSQINFRASDLTGRQLDTLAGLWGTSQTETISVAIDRIYRQEEPKMLETLLKKYKCFFHWSGETWCIYGTDQNGNAWETDSYEAANEEQARDDAVDYLLEYNS